MGMRRPTHDPEALAVLAVLAASAREAEELLSHEPNLGPEAVEEANRRLRSFMRAARNAQL